MFALKKCLKVRMETKHFKNFLNSINVSFPILCTKPGGRGGIFSLLPLLLNESPKGGFPTVAIVHLFCTIDTIVKD